MTARTKAIQAAILEVAEERPRWDEPPALYRVHVRDGETHLVDMGIEPQVWAASDVQSVLTGMSLLMVAGNFKPRPDDPAGELVGMAFRNEAFWVETELNDAQATHRMNKMAGEHRLWQHPGRVEVRIVIAVDRHGITYQAMHKRSGETEQQMMLPGRGEVQAAGAVVEALDAMVFALTGAIPPKRPSAYVETTEHLN
jgi:hypothetical protein